MTRINFGVRARELCDQHLVAEYKELPRAFSFGGRVVPGPFRLGRGHVLWCAQYPGSLATRYRSLVAEMLLRGFTVNFPAPRGDGRKARAADLKAARPIVQARILERLETMSPLWTRRQPPKWAKIRASY